MLTCICALPSSQSISKFISEHPSLSLLETKCSNMRDLKMLHAQMIKNGLANDAIANSRILSFCALSPFGDINYAMLLFSRTVRPNQFTWNCIIRGFSQSSSPQHALYLFINMLHTDQQPEKLTYPSVFKAYSQLGYVHEGSQLHGRIIKLGCQSDPFVRNSMISMYAICGRLESAKRLFDECLTFDIVCWNSMILGFSRTGLIDKCEILFDKMPQRSTVTWNTMISGYVRNHRFMEALNLFHKMQKEKIEPSEYTMVSLLNACSHLGALEHGKWIHSYIEKNLEINPIVCTSIIEMYCKCGCIVKALELFNASSQKGLSAWNCIIFGLAINGHCEEAINYFSKLQSSGLTPDHVSFLSILVACSHKRMVKEALFYFTLMIKTYNIKPQIEHYGCIVDVLGRAGLVKEAEELIKDMPVKADAIIWGSLLSSCRIHGNVEIGERASKQLSELDPRDTCSYILLSNVYASMGRFRDAIDERTKMKDKKIKKEPGCSLVEVNGIVDEFVADGRLHTRSKEIYVLLDQLGQNLIEERDAPNGCNVMDFDEAVY